MSTKDERIQELSADLDQAEGEKEEGDLALAQAEAEIECWQEEVDRRDEDNEVMKDLAHASINFAYAIHKAANHALQRELLDAFGVELADVDEG
jgi:F0F1-type ATP synthase membrane subunit b/b'